jgi:hypothetical protein
MLLQTPGLHGHQYPHPLSDPKVPGGHWRQGEKLLGLEAVDRLLRGRLRPGHDLRGHPIQVCLSQLGRGAGVQGEGAGASL